LLAATVASYNFQMKHAPGKAVALPLCDEPTTPPHPPGTGMPTICSVTQDAVAERVGVRGSIQ